MANGAKSTNPNYKHSIKIMNIQLTRNQLQAALSLLDSIESVSKEPNAENRVKVLERSFYLITDKISSNGFLLEDFRLACNQLNKFIEGVENRNDEQVLAYIGKLNHETKIILEQINR